ncbi:MAG: thermosome subunit [Halieaceae bacterium]|nr:thermosome subunit [Halieaceae bacterium]|tara:strand:+ start:3757 stop:5295 length:1539 start_codon:yes stop_codon:yes gene_type:complete
MSQPTDAKQQKQQTAQEVNISIGKFVAELVRSTLGPKGMDKQLVDATGRTVITNDGATILKETNFTHATAKMMVEVARTQEEECYDGTTSAIVKTGELLKQAEDLLAKRVHPTTIVNGYQIALAKCQEIIEDLTIPADEYFLDIAMTAMTGKTAEVEREHLAELCVKATEQAAPGSINVLSRYGSPVSESYAPDGILVGQMKMHSAMPSSLDNARIALIEGALDLPAMAKGTNLQFNSAEEAEAFRQRQRTLIANMAEHVANLGTNVILTMKDIHPTLAEIFARNGIIACRRCSASNLEAISDATNALIVAELEDLESDDLGTCEAIEEVESTNGQRGFFLLRGTPNKNAVSIVVQAPTQQASQEIARAMDDAIGVVHVARKEGKVLAGGGASQVELAIRLREFATSVGGLESLAVEAFADALEIIPLTLAENSGQMQPIATLRELRKAHAEGNKTAGLNVYTGEVVDMAEEKVVEPMKVVLRALESATSTASMLLRIDNIIIAREPDEFGE